MKKWERIEPTIKQKVGYRMIIEKHFRLPNGVEVDRTTINEDDWEAAGAIALTADNKVIVVRQFRPGPEMIMDEIPGGLVDKGETPEESAVREFREETGYQPGHVEYLGACYYDSYTNGKRHYFLFTGCTPTGKGQELLEDDHIELRFVSIAELLKIAKSGRMTDQGAVLLAYDTLMKLKEPK